VALFSVQGRRPARDEIVRISAELRAGDPSRIRPAIEEILANPSSGWVEPLSSAVSALGRNLDLRVQRREDAVVARRRARDRLRRLLEEAVPTPVARREAAEALSRAEEDVARWAEAVDLGEAAREILARGFGALLSFLGPPERDEAIGSAVRRLRSDVSFSARQTLLEALGLASSGPATHAMLRRLGEERDPRLLVLGLEALRRGADSRAIAPVAPLLRHPSWSVRAAAADVLGSIGEALAVPFLLEALRSEEGRLREDFGDALNRITGQRFAPDYDFWAAWWGRHAEGGIPEVLPESAPARVDPSVFYGIRTWSNRIVFVLDVSGSMLEPAGTASPGRRSSTRKIDVARREFTRAMAPLDDRGRFGVLLYSGIVFPFADRAEPALRERKDQAIAFVESTAVGGGTNLSDALEEALLLAGGGVYERPRDPEADTIFLLTDGFPTAGRLQAPEAIVREIRRVVRTSRIVVHCVGTGSHDRGFLRALAQATGGQFASR